MKSEHLNILQGLIGLDTKLVHEYLVKRGLMGSRFNGRSRGTSVENSIAFLISENLPGRQRGSDFTDFEVKTIQVKYTKTGLLRTCGDTAVSTLGKSETDFETSNTWCKLKSIISVLVYDDVIIDILYFSGDWYKGQLKKDYANLLKGENNHFRRDGKTWRSVEGRNNKLLARKDYRNGNLVISLIGSSILDLSVSVCKSPGLVIDDQNSYIEELLDNGVSNFLNNRNVLKSVKIGKSKGDVYNLLEGITDVKELISIRNFILNKLDRVIL